MTVTIRRMRPADRPQAEALWNGTSPYRPGDGPEVEAMYERALCALDLNTTTPQKPAIGLYHKLGFREAGRTFLDRYELVWVRLEL